MFLVDDLLLSPVKGILWVFKEIHDAAEQELAGEAEAITAALSELYQQLETGQITEAEFDTREKLLLDRLDRWQAAAATTPVPPKLAKPRPRSKRLRKKVPAARPTAII